MSKINIDLPDEYIAKLQETADRLGVSPADLIRASIEELLNQPEELFKQTLDYVMKKNAELYKRLA
jgi:predicted DNA-binding protein